MGTLPTLGSLVATPRGRRGRIVHLYTAEDGVRYAFVRMLEERGARPSVFELSELRLDEDRQAVADLYGPRVKRARTSPQEARLRRRYGVTTRRELLRAIAAEYTAETVDLEAGEKPYTMRDAELMLDGMLEAEYQRLEGGAS